MMGSKKLASRSKSKSALLANLENESTDHGDNIADQIAGSDVYGDKGILTATDVHNILDNMHSNVLRSRQPAKMKLQKLLSDWREELWKHFPEMEIR